MKDDAPPDGPQIHYPHVSPIVKLWLIERAIEQARRDLGESAKQVLPVAYRFDSPLIAIVLTPSLCVQLAHSVVQVPLTSQGSSEIMALLDTNNDSRADHCHRPKIAQ